MPTRLNEHLTSLRAPASFNRVPSGPRFCYHWLHIHHHHKDGPMIHGYHAIFGAYGFWLPNDPRGSWSDFVGAWELLRFGHSTKGVDRIELSPDQERVRRQAKAALKYPPVSFDGVQARAVGRGFAKACQKSDLTIWACAILPDHVHLVLARHRFKVEYVVGLLKGEATKQLKRESLHPAAETPWNSRCWRVYLDNDEAIESAIRYTNENPEKEDKPRQRWSFVTAFSGLDPGWVTYY